MPLRSSRSPKNGELYALSMAFFVASALKPGIALMIAGFLALRYGPRRTLPAGWWAWGGAILLCEALLLGLFMPLLIAIIDAGMDMNEILAAVSVLGSTILLGVPLAGALAACFASLPPVALEERIQLARSLPAGLRISARRAGEPGGMRLGDPILDGALYVECDDEEAARDLLTDEDLRGDLLALFCEHPGAVLADGEIVISCLQGRALPHYRWLAQGRPFYGDGQLEDARRAASALAGALAAPRLRWVSAERTERRAARRHQRKQRADK